MTGIPEMSGMALISLASLRMFFSVGIYPGSVRSRTVMPSYSEVGAKYFHVTPSHNDAMGELLITHVL
jgi:hypothetical protein